MAPTPAWSRISSSRRCSTSRATPARRHGRRRRDRAAWAKLAADARREGDPHRRARHAGRRRPPKKPGEFVNTWSIDGFVGEGCQPAELGWGTHEKALPPDGAPPRFRLRRGDLPAAPGRLDARAHLDAAGRAVPRLPDHAQRDRSRSPTTTRCATRTVRCVYRPTVHYAYHPCDDAVLSVHELAGRNWQLQPEKRLMMDEIRPAWTSSACC